MKKVLFTVVFLCLAGFTFSQGLHLGIGGGLSVVTGPKGLTDALNGLNASAFGGAGFGAEYNIAAKAKLSLPLIPIVPTAFIQYHFLNASVNTPVGEFKSSMNVFSLGAGGELSLIPGPLSPYVAVDIIYNNFMEGKLEYPGGSTVFSASRSRMGLGLGAGLEFKLIPMINFDLNAKYNMLNIIGKESNEETVNFFTVDLFLFF